LVPDFQGSKWAVISGLALPKRPLEKMFGFGYNAPMDTKTQSENTAEKLELTHGGYFQETFRLKRLGRAFLKKGLPKKVLKYLDLENLTVESRHLGDDMFKETIADVLYKVPIKGTDEYINFFIIVEHKSRQDYPTIFQLWGYVFRVCYQEFYATDESVREKAGYRLPPVVAIILHHGKSKFKGKTELLEYFYSLPGLEKHLPRFQAILFDLSTIEDDDPILNDPEVPELRVVLLVLKTIFRSEVPLTLEDVLRELKPYSDDPETRRLIRATWIYLTSNAEYMQKNIDALLGTFEEITGDKIMPTMVEVWKEEGRAEVAAVVKNMVLTALRTKFGKVPKWVEKAILGRSDTIALESLHAQALQCDTLDEFSEMLR